MPDPRTKQLVNIVIKATTQNHSEAQLIQSLTATGIKQTIAPTLIATVRDGFKAGVQFAVTGTEAHNIETAEEIYLCAYQRGKKAMQYTSPPWLILRSLTPRVITIGLLALILYKLLF